LSLRSGDLVRAKGHYAFIGESWLDREQILLARALRASDAGADFVQALLYSQKKDSRSLLFHIARRRRLTSSDTAPLLSSRRTAPNERFFFGRWLASND